MHIALVVAENVMPANGECPNIRAALRIAATLASDLVLLYTLRTFTSSFLRIRALIVRGPYLDVEDTPCNSRGVIVATDLLLLNH